MILKVLRPEEPHERTIYANVIKVREVPMEEETPVRAEEGGRFLEIELADGESRRLFYEPGRAFLMSEDGHTIDRL